MPGQQHMHGETYGANAETTLRERATANNKQYLTKSDLVRETLSVLLRRKPFQP